MSQFTSELASAMQQLYNDDVYRRVAAAKNILRIGSSSDGLTEITQSETILGILARIQREETKILTDLPIAIACVFLSLASHPQYHEILRQNRCGDVCLRSLEFELYRFLPSPELVDLQDRLMHICLAVLYLLSEDRAVERKTIGRGMIPLLVKLTLTRKDPELVHLALKFLLRASVIEDYKDQIIQSGSGEAVVNFAMLTDGLTGPIAMKLLFNLSLDEHGNRQISRSKLSGIIPDVLRVPNLRAGVVRLLSLLPELEICSEALLLLMQMSVVFPGDSIPEELAACIGNFSASSAGATAVGESLMFCDLVKRGLKKIPSDSRIFQILKNVVCSSRGRSAALINLNRKYLNWFDELLSSLNKTEGLALVPLLGFATGLIAASLESPSGSSSISSSISTFWKSGVLKNLLINSIGHSNLEISSSASAFIAVLARLIPGKDVIRALATAASRNPTCPTLNALGIILTTEPGLAALITRNEISRFLDSANAGVIEPLEVVIKIWVAAGPSVGAEDASNELIERLREIRFARFCFAALNEFELMES